MPSTGRTAAEAGPQAKQAGAAATVLAPKQAQKLYFQLMQILSTRVITILRWSGFLQLGSHQRARIAPRWDYVAFKIPRRAPKERRGRTCRRCFQGRKGNEASVGEYQDYNEEHNE